LSNIRNVHGGRELRIAQCGDRDLTLQRHRAVAVVLELDPRQHLRLPRAQLDADRIVRDRHAGARRDERELAVGLER
jgi:hypothetical protein